MPLTNAQKLELLRTYPDALGVWTKIVAGKPRIVLLLDKQKANQETKIAPNYQGLPLVVQFTDRFTTLELRGPCLDTACYNEPIPGGVQIQPFGANWVGTLGAACQFHDEDGVRRWGFLSNWHVLVTDPNSIGHVINQPTDAYPRIGHVSTWQDVSWTSTNYFDAALADAMVDGLHTVGPEIREIGQPYPVITHPIVGMEVHKTGRTTDKTSGVCIAIDAAVRVGYNSHTATFAGQAVFTGDANPFSAPGDSGSLILDERDNTPAALLFAGNSELTIGSPIAPIAHRFDLSFQFPD